MSTTPTTQDVASALATFSPTEAALRELVANSAPLLHATDATAEQLHAARMPLKNARVDIDKRRKDLIAPALEFQRAVNEHAKALVALVEPTETALEQRQRALEAEERAAKERKRRAALELAEEWARQFAAVGYPLSVIEALDADQDLLAARLNAATAAYAEAQRKAAEERAAAEAAEAAARAQREAAEAAARAQREAEEQERARKAAEEREAVRREREALEAERKAEAAKRAEEARALAEARAREEAELRAQREALAAQQREIEAAKRAAQEAERQRLAAEAAVKAEAERKARALAAAPLAAQVRELAERVGGIQGPDDARCHAILHGAATDLERYAAALEAGEVTV